MIKLHSTTPFLFYTFWMPPDHIHAGRKYGRPYNIEGTRKSSERIFPSLTKFFFIITVLKVNNLFKRFVFERACFLLL